MSNSRFITSSLNIRNTLRLLFGSFLHGTLCGSRFEAFHAAGGINHLVIAGIKRMTCAANFNVKFRLGRADGKNRPAGAGYFGLRIELWVNVLFHCK